MESLRQADVHQEKMKRDGALWGAYTFQLSPSVIQENAHNTASSEGCTMNLSR